MPKLDIGTLENWLWEAASAIRGAVEANKYKDYILPLIFLTQIRKKSLPSVK